MKRKPAARARTAPARTAAARAAPVPAAPAPAAPHPAVSAPAAPAPAVPAPGRSVIQAAYDFLVSEGFPARLLPDGDPRFSRLAFLCDGAVLHVSVDERDPDFLAVSLRRTFDPPLPDELTALRLASAVQDTHKLVRIAVGPDLGAMYFQASVLLGGRPPTRELLSRCVGILQHTSAEVEDLLRGTTRGQA